MGDFVRALHVRFICAALSAVLATISPLGAAGVAHAATTVPTASATDREGGESAASLEASTTASVVREATELRTENSKHFVLSDGSMRAEIYSAPIHYKDESGAFVALDTRLVQEDAHGTHRTAAAGARARFRGAGVPGKPVTLQRGGLTIDIDMVGVPEKAHVAFGRTAYYPAVAPSTALAYESLADGLKQTLVLADKAAPCTFQFAVTISGGVLRKTPGDGWAVFAADNDRPVFDLGEIAVWDSAAEPSVCDSATLEVVPQAGGALLTYRVPREWLDDPTRVYPVYVDPTFNDTASQDTYIHSTGNTAAHGGSAYLYSGKNTTTGSNYALLKFELGSIMGAKINSATFSVYCSSLVANTYVYLRRNTGYWSEGWKYSDGLPASDYLANKKLAATGWVDWDVKTTVQQWVDSVGAPYWYGFQLMNPSTDGGNHYKQYYSSEYATTSLRPKLVVDYTLVPDPVAASGTTVASEWFREVDRNGDGVSDTPNDEPGRGRGLVDLTWPQAARATGYNIYAFDGDSYEKVGTVFGGATTSWSSGGAGMFPTDSEIKNWSVGARNAFTRAASPRKMSKETQFNAGGQGENVGVLVGDGKHLYTRGWRTDAGFGGSDAWIRIGSGYGGTTAGQNLGQVGPDFTDKPVMSAFYLDGVIYNGYAETSASVSGVPRDAGAGEERTVGIRFHDEAGLPKPLVDRGAGRDLTGESPHVLLASDGDRIYNVAYGIGGVGGAGYTVREFDRTGLWLGDHVIPMPSEMLDGVLADGEALYLMQWNNTDSAHVTKVRTADWKVANQWPIDQATTGVINGCYDKTTNHFWLGSLTSGTVYKYLGSGLDLRDDPNALYRKSTTQAYLNNHNYWFRVVPFNAYGEASLDSCGAYMPTLDNRSIRVNDEDRDTTHTLGECAGHDMAAVLDEHALEIDVTDLAISTWGPQAAVTRHYTSGCTETGLLADAPGWRFDFERTLIAVTGGALFKDAEGDEHRFVKPAGSSVYISPNGRNDRLKQDPSGDWVLVAKDRSREVYDGATGKLKAVYDKNNNAVTYTWGASALTITAANGQSIEVALTGGKAASATCETDDGTRKVVYAISGAPRVTYFPEDAGCRYVIDYAYVGDLLRSLTVVDYPTQGQNATWGFGYEPNSKALIQVQTPLHPADMHARTTLEYPAAYSATVTTYGDVGDAGTLNVAEDAPIEIHYTWNPTGTMASMRDAHKAGTADPAPWTYAYSQGNDAISELSPTGKLICRSFDTRGNMLSNTDEEGNRTTYEYDALDQVTRMIDERLCTTTYEYSTGGYEGTGNLTRERKQLNATERSTTEHDYDSVGRTIATREYITGTTYAETLFGPFSDSGEPLETTRVGVILSPGTAPVSLTESSTYDDFGNLTSSTDASGTITNSSSYDIAGRVISSTDAAGVTTQTRYDALGNETMSWREAAGQVADKVTKSYDRSGRTVSETYWLGGTQDRSITHSYDASGRETVTNDSRVSGEARTVYDARGNTVLAWAEGTDVGKLTAATRSTFDAYGQLTSQIASGETSATTHEYYANGRTKKTTNPDGSYTRYLYDAGGLVAAEYTPGEDSEEAVKTSTYDTGGRLVSSVTADGAASTYTYDLLSRQVSAGAEGQAASTTVYNSLGWVLTETDSDGVAKTKSYDAAGRVVEETEAGKASTTKYDEHGRTRLTTNADGTTTSYVYDAFSRTVSESQVASGGAGIKTTTTGYDALSRATTVTVQDLRSGTTRRTAVSYPATGQPETVVTYSQPGVTTAITLDAQNRETVRSSETSAGTLTRSTTAFDAANRETDWTFRGVASSREFDAAGRLAKQSGEGFSGAASYAFDPTTGRKSVESLPFSLGGAESGTYTYTDVGRLASASIGALTTYAYDTAGSLTTVTAGSDVSVFSYDSANRLIAKSVNGVPDKAYTWDTARGWRTGEGPAGGAPVRTFTYTDAGRLARYTDASTQTDATYTYDATGLRTSSVVRQGSVTTTSTYTYEGLTLLSLDAVSEEGTATSAWRIDYLTDATGRPYGGIYTSGETSPVAFGIVTTDRGDVRELTDGAGVPFARYDHDAYGNPTRTLSAATPELDAATAAAIAGRNILRYAGYAFDEHSGLYYLSQRYYDPATCQFITKHPAKADGEESAYQYCGGDPVGKVDPSGERAEFGHTRVRRNVVSAHAIAWGIGFMGLRTSYPVPAAASTLLKASISWFLMPSKRLLVRIGLTYDVGYPSSVMRFADATAQLRLVLENSAGGGRREAESRPVSLRPGRGRLPSVEFTCAASQWISAIGLKATVSSVMTSGLSVRPRGSKTRWSANPFGVHRPGWARLSAPTYRSRESHSGPQARHPVDL